MIGGRATGGHERGPVAGKDRHRLVGNDRCAREIGIGAVLIDRSICFPSLEQDAIGIPCRPCFGRCGGSDGNVGVVLGCHHAKLRASNDDVGVVPGGGIPVRKNHVVRAQHRRREGEKAVGAHGHVVESVNGDGVVRGEMNAVGLDGIRLVPILARIIPQRQIC